VVAEAAHTRVETAKQILYEPGADYLLTVKENQQGLFATLATLLTEQRFSQSTAPAHPRPESGAQLGAA